MKKKDIQDLKTKSLPELKKILAKALLELARLKFTAEDKKGKNVHLYLNKRRDIARIKTIISEKELMEEL